MDFSRVFIPADKRRAGYADHTAGYTGYTDLTTGCGIDNKSALLCQSAYSRSGKSTKLSPKQRYIVSFAAVLIGVASHKDGCEGETRKIRKEKLETRFLRLEFAFFPLFKKQYGATLKGLHILKNQEITNSKLIWYHYFKLVYNNI